MRGTNSVRNDASDRGANPVGGASVVGVECILDYLHDAAGFAIAIKPNVPLDQTSPRPPMPPANEEQALHQLKQAVAEIGCTVVQRGHLLTIVTEQEAKKQFLPLPRIGD